MRTIRKNACHSKPERICGCYVGNTQRILRDDDNDDDAGKSSPSSESTFHILPIGAGFSPAKATLTGLSWTDMTFDLVVEPPRTSF